uniref:Uncharacterized protein n=1 Tax=Anopheles merus TaxID=30066 RepID=A0A182VPH7_ANOME
MTTFRYVWLACLGACIIIISTATAARQRTTVVSDVCSTSFTDGPFETRDAYRRRVRDPNKHISARLVRYLTFGGILQAIAEKTNLPRDRLVAGGASQFQDQHSGQGRTVHAAHIIRVGTIDQRLGTQDSALHTALTNYIGHTQNVLRAANAWHGVGGEIDRFQSNNLDALGRIDFNAPFDRDQRIAVEQLIERFRDVITAYVRDGTHEESDKQILDDDKMIVNCMLPLMLFEEGKAGYDMVTSGDFVAHYGRTSSKS